MTQMLRPFIIAVAATAVLVSVPSSAAIAGDTLELEGAEVVLGIHNVNPGSCRDTIMGRMSRDDQVIPTRIIWGACDTSLAGGSPRTTRIQTPPWSRLRFSMGMQDVNGDTLTDLLFFSTGRPAGRTAQADSLRAVVVFGQSGIDTLQQLRVSTIAPGLQSLPFFALELEHGTHLLYPQQRDIVGRTSFILVRLSSATGDSSSAPSMPTPRIDGIRLSITPNPARSLATISADGLHPERYRLRLVAMNGTVYHESLIDVGATGQLSDVCELAGIPTGYYVAILDVRGQRRAAYPLVIVR